MKHKQKLFHYWFNTYFANEAPNCKSFKVSPGRQFTNENFFQADPDGNVIYELNKSEIDDAHKDKQKIFSENFKVSRRGVATEKISNITFFASDRNSFPTDSSRSSSH
jgi:hypothetical protein